MKYAHIFFKNYYFMTHQLEKNEQSNLIRRESIIGSRTLSNYWWSSTLLLFSCAFFITGVLSYFHFQFFPFSKFFENITFFPQGLVMCFYGFLGFIISIYLWFTLIWCDTFSL